jgi:hypothetical protein
MRHLNYRDATFYLSQFLFAIVFTVALLTANSLALAANSDEEKNKKSCASVLDFKKLLNFNPSVALPADGRAPYLSVSDENNWVANFANSISRLLSPVLGGYPELTRPVQILQAHLSRNIDQFIVHNKPGIDEDFHTPPYWQMVAQALQLKILTYPATLTELPPKGAPLLLPMNHALHGVEAMALAAALSEHRPDCRILMTDALRQVPGMKEHSFMIPVHGSNVAARSQMEAMRRVTDYLKRGGCVIMFPAGSVSAELDSTGRFIEDSEWQSGLHYLYSKVPETTLWPVFAEGRPSRFFVWVKRNLPGADGAFHIAEMVDRTRAPVRLRFAKPYKAGDLSTLTKADFLNEVRSRLYEQRSPPITYEDTH